MKTSQNGIDLIKQFEGCRLTAYKCPAGVWTIGYGHTAGVKQGQVITQEQAEAYLKQDLNRFEAKVEKYDAHYRWNQNEFDALVSFVYNIGSIEQLTGGGTRPKTVIAEKILLYNKAGGKVLAGLERRRAAERKLFLAPVDKAQQETEIREYSLKKDGNRQISKNFKVKEFACRDGSDRILVDTGFVVSALQKIRDHFNTAVTINSGYRTQEYNKKVGGAAKSYHMSGKAFDISVKGKTPEEVAKYAKSININGVIQYDTFVHLDSREERYWTKK